ncbi:hypothetical protein B0O80DRAFT_441261 [Mortierella sp. GBAus27b]|nr:hypothetical protein B0O80DRAFT_441261 [Mortierella sp. GBAus27b]
MTDTTRHTARQEAAPLLHPDRARDLEQGRHGSAHHDDSCVDTAHKVDRLQHHREMVRVRFSANWWIEWIIILVVFSVTGSSTMLITRPLMKALGFDGSLGAGPWSFRIAYIILMFPLYSCMLLLISSIACRRSYFEHLLIRMWGRLLPTRIIKRCSGKE